jgi:hypothetical protein
MKCEECGTELETGYGFAGGGFGPYHYCPKCERVVDKIQDPEMEVKYETGRDRGLPEGEAE